MPRPDQPRPAKPERAKEKKERPPNPLEPDGRYARVWLSRGVPYEHVVITPDEMHPKLREQVDEVRKWVAYSRMGIDGLGIQSAILAFPLIPMHQRLMIMAAAFSTATLGSSLHSARIRAEESDEHQIKAEFRKALRGRILPYVDAARLTVGIGRTIKEIAENEEAPFLRDDCGKLMRKYHYGIVDNGGNIVLLRHPSASHATGWRRLRQMFAFHQPFQRTRFELQKPERKAKAKKPVLLPNGLPQGVRLAVAPFRITLDQG